MTTPNFISREQILEILKKNSNDNGRRYTLLTILKYNVTLDVDDVIGFLKNNDDNTFLSVVKNIDSIKFERTINMLQDLNDLLFIFYEKSTELKKMNPNTVTKKTHSSLNTKKKTIKKQYKD
jgi:hypothetical protein